jgi:hypothetical protein
MAKEFGPSIDVSNYVVGVYTQPLRCVRHELHESNRASSRFGVGLKARFGPRHRHQQFDIDSVPIGGIGKEIAQDGRHRWRVTRSDWLGSNSSRIAQRCAR